RLNQDRISALDTIRTVVLYRGHSLLVREHAEADFTVKVAAGALVWCCENNSSPCNRLVVALRHANGYRHHGRLTNYVSIAFALHNLKAQPNFGLRIQAPLRSK